LAYSKSPQWLLSLDRSTAITGGVSAHVPATFLMAALSAWLYSRRRISSVNDSFAFRLEYDPTTDSSPTTHSAILERIASHRARFDLWFLEPVKLFRHFGREKLSWREFMPTLIAAAFLVGTFMDTLVFRPISRSDDGFLFDVYFRFGFGLILTLFALNFARLHSVWHDLGATLDGFAKILSAAFERIPRNISHWLTDTESCEMEYGYLIRRQINSLRDLFTGWEKKAEPPKTAMVWEIKEALRHLSILEQCLGDTRRPGLRQNDGQLAAFRYFTRLHRSRWADAPVGHLARPDKGEADKVKAEPTREEKIIEYLEDLLALEAARWAGGALVRVWLSIGFLAFSAVALLFAITSYPFPEQSRVMAVIGLMIAALVVMVLRVALGTSRNEVISKIDGTSPGRITWNSMLFSSVGTYVVPLVGLLTAVSFDLLDLFRSLLGPILRIFP
jgi:hypothetical protein